MCMDSEGREALAEEGEVGDGSWEIGKPLCLPWLFLEPGPW